MSNLDSVGLIYVMPNLIGMPAMDAIAVLENMNFDVKLIGNGNDEINPSR